jgi:hypothetical protein
MINFVVKRVVHLFGLVIWFVLILFDQLIKSASSGEMRLTARAYGSNAGLAVTS